LGAEGYEVLADVMRSRERMRCKNDQITFLAEHLVALRKYVGSFVWHQMLDHVVHDNDVKLRWGIIVKDIAMLNVLRFTEGLKILLCLCDRGFGHVNTVNVV